MARPRIVVVRAMDTPSTKDAGSGKPVSGLIWPKTVTRPVTVPSNPSRTDHNFQNKETALHTCYLQSGVGLQLLGIKFSLMEVIKDSAGDGPGITVLGN